MSDAARIASQVFLQKPAGMKREHFLASPPSLAQIQSCVYSDAAESAYASVVSYAEAISGLMSGRTSWSVVKLYYSAYYSIRSLMLANFVVPFHCKEQYLLDARDNLFLKGGNSSHQWNWSSIRAVKRLNHWYFSTDAEQAYDNLRNLRERANYNQPFIDPSFPIFIHNPTGDLAKVLRVYRDDKDLFYTFLLDHFCLAFPTRLIYLVDETMHNLGLGFDGDRSHHLKSVWSLKDRCPLL